MSEIKINKKERVVYDITYETSDGNKFDNEADALFHQEILDGKKRYCEVCSGKGYFSMTKEITDPNYPPNLPDSGWVTIKTQVKEPCVICSGKGHLVYGWH